MFKILNKFLIKRFFYGSIVVILTISGIIFSITFIERLNYNDNIFNTCFDAFGRLLEYIPLFLPIAIFISTLWTVYKLIKSSEYIIFTSIGLSTYQIAKPFLVFALILGVFTTTIINHYSIKINNSKITEENLKLVDGSLWIREKYKDEVRIFIAKNILIKNDKINLHNLTIFREIDNYIIERIETKNAIIDNYTIKINKADIWTKNILNKKSNLLLKTSLDKETIIDRYLLPSQISFWKLPKFILNMKNSGVQLNPYLVQFWTLLFLPLSLVAMTILSLSFTHTKQRRNYNFIIQFVLALLSCFLLYFIINLFNSFGSLGFILPLISVIVPQLIIISIAGIIITSTNKI